MLEHALLILNAIITILPRLWCQLLGRREEARQEKERGQEIAHSCLTLSISLHRVQLLHEPAGERAGGRRSEWFWVTTCPSTHTCPDMTGESQACREDSPNDTRPTMIQGLSQRKDALGPPPPAARQHTQRQRSTLQHPTLPELPAAHTAPGYPIPGVVHCRAEPAHKKAKLDVSGSTERV